MTRHASVFGRRIVLRPFHPPLCLPDRGFDGSIRLALMPLFAQHFCTNRG